MNTFLNKYDSIEKIIFDEGLRIWKVDIYPDSDHMNVFFDKSHYLNIRLSLYDRLKSANADQLLHFELIAGKTGIYWPDLDEDLSLKGFLEEFLRKKLAQENELIIA